MIINTDLRQAIKSAVAMRNAELTFSQKEGRKRTAIRELLNHPKYRARARAAERDRARAAELNKRAGKFFESLGLYDSGNGFADVDAFRKAGGVLPTTENLRFEVIMAKVAAASPKEGAKMLRELGIDWS